MKHRGRYGEKDREWIRLRDPNPNEGWSDGFYAIWSRSRKRLLVTITVNRATDAETAQLGLQQEQVARLDEFIAAGDLGTEAALELEDHDDASSPRRLRATWSRAGSRLLVRLIAGDDQQPIGAVDLHADQVARLGRFLAAGAPNQ